MQVPMVCYACPKWRLKLAFNNCTVHKTGCWWRREKNLEMGKIFKTCFALMLLSNHSIFLSLSSFPVNYNLGQPFQLATQTWPLAAKRCTLIVSGGARVSKGRRRQCEHGWRPVIGEWESDDHFLLHMVKWINNKVHLSHIAPLTRENNVE